MSRFTGKVALITGSSSGIGRATALLLAREGARITITGRNADRLQETRNEIVAAGVPESHVNSVIADVLSEAGQTELIESTINAFGRLDILVNNAGASFPDPEGKKGSSQSIQTYDATFAINVRCVVELVQKAKPHLIASQGEIVNVSSIAGMPTAQPVLTYYAMAKAALDQLTRSTAIELIEHGIRVNSVSPGVVMTGFNSAMGMTEEACTNYYNYMQQHRDCIPTGKAGTPQDIANIIAFLADRNTSSYIIGQSIVADGGTSLMLAMRAHLLNMNKNN